MESKAQNGVWPVMLTPFTDTGRVDYKALEALIQWYEERGVSGLFAVCQSSEMFFLSLQERVELSRFIKRTAHVPVISSGHTSYSIDDQIDELKRVADTGVDAVILITNRLAEQGSAPAVWRNSLDQILAALPGDLPLGFYECPYPYKRLISDSEISYAAGTGRFHFLKDTCCGAALIQRRLELIKGSSLRLFNANTATILDSLRHGAAGFSGVMANFHPELYVWLCRNWDKEPERAELVQAFLTMASQIEKQLYPVNAKAYLQGKGLPITIYTRSKNHHEMSPLFLSEVEQLDRLTEWFKKKM